ncbi:redoxin domain-containing protein [Synechococcales cyanobacterium C]|uniref:Redoxin domain-containing protein n=2 Tax=Petrachloros TaxID=2918834 RepID=A0A8K2A8C0_9CYAN|nr:redoxin domain-containing protein [Petrachloros mirabilis ULC683]
MSFKQVMALSLSFSSLPLSAALAMKPPAIDIVHLGNIGEALEVVETPWVLAQANTVGGPLAPELQGKPVVVDIHASWCPACRNIAPTLSQLRQQYGDRVHFVKLDVSDRAQANQSEQKAKRLGLGQFFATHKSRTGTVVIVDAATGRILAQHSNNASKDAYTRVLNTALSQK